jgi:hypothetical protein
VSRNRVLSTVLTAAVSSPAAAATICVSPSGGPCQTTIQAAVNLAGPGDVVKIGAGIYFENVVVPAGKDGIQILGAGKLTTIIDPDVPNSGLAIRVFSDNVQIRSLSIRNGQGGIGLEGNGAVVSGVRIVGIRGLTSGAIFTFPGTSGHQILSNEIRSVNGSGIHLGNGSAGTLIQGNTITQISNAGVLAQDVSNVQVLSNKVTGSVNHGILLVGTGSLATGNVIELAGGYGLLVAGNDPVVRVNRVTNAGPTQVECVPCSGGLAVANSNVGSDYYGLLLSADSPGFTAQSNKVANAAAAGVLIDGASVQAAMNTVTDSGAFGGSGSCFLVRGAGAHTLRKNGATRCTDSGFLIETSNVTLDGNVVSGAGLNGFTLFGNGGGNADNDLVGNRASFSNAAGFAITDGAVNTVLSGNSSTKNRYDFCDDGTGTDTSGGNSFASQSTVCTDVVH